MQQQLVLRLKRTNDCHARQITVSEYISSGKTAVLVLDTPKPTPPGRRRRELRMPSVSALRVLLACCVAAVATFPGHSFGWAFFLPAIRQDLELSRSQASSAWALACVVTSPCLVVGGRLVTRWGARRALCVSGIFFAACVACAGIALNGLGSGVGGGGAAWATLSLLFFLLRVSGPGLVYICCGASLGAWFGVTERGRASLFFSSATWLMITLQNAVPPLEAWAKRKNSSGDSGYYQLAYFVMGGCTLVLLCVAVSLHAGQPQVPEGAAAAAAAGRGRQEVQRLRPLASYTAVEARRTGLFWSLALGQCALEALFVGSQYHILDILREAASVSMPARAAQAQTAGALLAVACTVGAGLAHDSLGSSHSARLVLGAALALGALGVAGLLLLGGDAAAFVFCGAINGCMGISDVATSSVYAALFGTEHVAELLGMQSALAHLAVGTSPLLFDLTRHAFGTFRPMLLGLLTWLAVAATCIYLASPTAGFEAETGAAAAAAATVVVTPEPAGVARARTKSVGNGDDTEAVRIAVRLRIV